MICDSCEEILPQNLYLEQKNIEVISNDKTVLNIRGAIPKDTEASIIPILKEEAILLAKQYINIEDENVITAYDISLKSDTMKYQPVDYNQYLKVNLSNIKLEENRHYALLHIMDEGNFEVLPISKISNQEIEFKTTRFSTYILIAVEGHNVTFDGENYKVFDIEGNEITNGTTISSGTDFQFVIVPNDGYGVTDVTCVNAASESIIEFSGYIKGKTAKIASVTEDLTIYVTTVLAPEITTEPVTAKVKAGNTAKFTVVAENATTYQWQYRENRDTYWKNVGSSLGSGYATATYTTSATGYVWSSYEFRCLIGNDNFTGHERVASDIVLVSVAADDIVQGETPIILVQPNTDKSKVAVNTGKASYSVTALGTNLTFTWQYRENRDTYWKTMVSSVGSSKNTVIDSSVEMPTTESTLTTATAVYSMEGYEFRCLVGNTFYKNHDAVKSDVVIISVADDNIQSKVQYHKLTINNQPETQKVKIGDVATFTIATEGVNRYKWQYKTSQDDVFWKDINAKLGTEYTIASGFNTATLQIDTSNMVLDEETLTVSNNLSGYLFRCVISNSNLAAVTKNSNMVVLSVALDDITIDAKLLEEPTLDVMTQVYIGVGKDKTFEVNYNGDGQLSIVVADSSCLSANIEENKITMKGLSEGETTITVKATKGTNYVAKDALINVNVVSNDKILITEWTIPVDANGVNGTTSIDEAGNTVVLGSQTTIKLPIPSNDKNNYTVDWGDGTFDVYKEEEFPTHTYHNTSIEKYNIEIIGTVNSFGYYREDLPTTTNIYQNYDTFIQYVTGIIQWGIVDANRYGFANCVALSGTIPMPSDLSFANVSDMSYLFYRCSNLRGEIPTGFFANCTNVTGFQSTFDNCSNLTGKILKNLFVNTKNVITFKNTFKDCKGLSGNIPYNLFANNIEVTSFEGVFDGCMGLTGMVPVELFVKNTKATNFSKAFQNCSNITAGEFKLNTNVVTSMDNMFAGCTNLESVVFQNEFKNLVGANMFQNCSALRAIILLNMPTNVSEVGTILNSSELALNSNTIIYVPDEEEEVLYEEAWSQNGYTKDNIERMIQAVEPNPDHVKLNQEYSDPGYTVAGFTIDEAEKYTQYGFYVEVTGNPVDTSEVGSEWIKYELKKY